MTMTDPIADMLTRIRNGNVAFHDEVAMPTSKVKEALAKILEREGYIVGFDIEDQTDRPGKKLKTHQATNPSVATRQKLAKALGVPVAELLEPLLEAIPVSQPRRRRGDDDSDEVIEPKNDDRQLLYFVLGGCGIVGGIAALAVLMALLRKLCINLRDRPGCTWPRPRPRVDPKSPALRSCVRGVSWPRTGYNGESGLPVPAGPSGSTRRRASTGCRCSRR